MSKDKYQEALDYIKGVVPLLKGRIIAYVEKIGLPNSIKILEELVDIYPEYLELKAKATPMKPYNQFMTSCLEGTDSWRTAIYATSCRRCHYTFDEIGQFEYCPNCSQAIDWSE